MLHLQEVWTPQGTVPSATPTTQENQERGIFQMVLSAQNDVSFQQLVQSKRKETSHETKIETGEQRRLQLRQEFSAVSSNGAMGAELPRRKFVRRHLCHAGREARWRHSLQGKERNMLKTQACEYITRLQWTLDRDTGLFG